MARGILRGHDYKEEADDPEIGASLLSFPPPNRIPTFRFVDYTLGHHPPFLPLHTSPALPMFVSGLGLNKNFKCTQ